MCFIKKEEGYFGLQAREQVLVSHNLISILV
jgi:hypothetical protein